MSHEANQPQMTRKKARELLPRLADAARADWDGNQEFWCVDTRTNWPTARLIASWYRVNRLVS